MRRAQTTSTRLSFVRAHELTLTASRNGMPGDHSRARGLHGATQRRRLL